MAVSDDRKESPPRGYQSDGGLVPVPDPTSLTQALVREAIGALRSEFAAKFDAINEATRIVKEDYVRVPTVVDRATKNLQDLLEEKIAHDADISSERFSAISEKFTASGKAVDTAFASSAAAISKSEIATTENIKQLNTLLDSKFSALDRRVSDVTSRLDRGEGSDKGAKDHTATMLAVSSIVITLVIAVVAALTFALRLH
jgi:hypothetical protein